MPKTKRRKVIKISANLPLEDFARLERLSHELGISMTDVIRKSLILQDQKQSKK